MKAQSTSQSFPRASLKTKAGKHGNALTIPVRGSPSKKPRAIPKKSQAQALRHTGTFFYIRNGMRN
jgi:hypothetical protein